MVHKVQCPLDHRDHLVSVTTVKIVAQPMTEPTKEVLPRILEADSRPSPHKLSKRGCNIHSGLRLIRGEWTDVHDSKSAKRFKAALRFLAAWLKSSPQPKQFPQRFQQRMAAAFGRFLGQGGDRPVQDLILQQPESGL